MVARRKVAPLALLIDTNVAAHAVTAIRYLVARALDRRAATAAVSDLLDLVTVVPSGDSDFRRALTLGVADFADAVQVTAFLQCGANVLVSPNSRDFRAAKIETRTPGEVLALIASISR